MFPEERTRWYFLVFLRSVLALLDLVGILTIGFIVSSVALFLTSGSDPDRSLEFVSLQLPAVNAQTLPWVSMGVLALFLAKALLSIMLTKKAAFFIASVEARSARTIVEVTLGRDLGEARKRSREEVMFAIQVGSPSAFNTLLNAANTFVAEAVLFVAICVAFLFVDPWATLAAVVYFGLIAVVMQFFVGSLMSSAAKAAAEGSLKANTAISDLFSVFRELFVLGRREKYVEDIFRARVAAAEGSAAQYYLAGMPRYIIEGALLVGVALFVVLQALAGDIVKSAATIGVFLSGGFRLTAALLPLQNALLTMNGAIPSAKTAHDILALSSTARPSLTFQPAPQSQEQQLGDTAAASSSIGVQMDNVSFTYPGSDQPALTNISFKVAPGAQVALMGPSGAGKSTIADLICTVVRPTGGSIVLSDSKGNNLSLDLRGQVSYVPQRPGLVSGTILDNVALGDDPNLVDRDYVLEALRLAHLSELLSELPEGVDTPLGKLMDSLAGGQVQRLGLARALYSKPGLLVMDEATSALDAESEAEIQKALDGMRGIVTVVIVAHRLNTIQHADRVILVESGQIKDSGTFTELRTRNPSVERGVDLMKVQKD